MSSQASDLFQKWTSRAGSRLGAVFGGGPAWRGGPGDIVATVYDDGVILAVSASVREVIGAAGNLVGRSLFDFIARADRARVRGVLEYAAERGDYADPSKLETSFTLLRVRRAAGPAVLTARPVGRGRLQILIREQRREKAAPALPTQLSPVAEPARNGMQADIIADLAHELKTPLNAIIGFADAMRAETYGEIGHDKYKEYIEHIHASGAHLSALIGAAQDYARAETGRYAIVREETSPAALLDDCAAMICGAAEAAGLTLDVDGPADMAPAMIDPRAVKQILINLLSNAVKFTKEGGVALRVEEQGDTICFQVADTGVGMNKVMLAKLGARYSDTHRDGVRGARGSGLGLSLAFELTRLHGGALTIDSTPGAGTVARLTLPRTEAQLETPPSGHDIQSQLDRVNAFRAERAGIAKNAASAA
ncbi:MAG: PAS domain-containing sensor histidine kinase [Pseudomonadota bacterium]